MHWFHRSVIDVSGWLRMWLLVGGALLVVVTASVQAYQPAADTCTAWALVTIHHYFEPALLDPSGKTTPLTISSLTIYDFYRISWLPQHHLFLTGKDMTDYEIHGLTIPFSRHYHLTYPQAYSDNIWINLLGDTAGSRSLLYLVKDVQAKKSDLYRVDFKGNHWQYLKTIDHLTTWIRLEDEGRTVAGPMVLYHQFLDGTVRWSVLDLQTAQVTPLSGLDAVATDIWYLGATPDWAWLLFINPSSPPATTGYTIYRVQRHSGQTQSLELPLADMIVVKWPPDASHVLAYAQRAQGQVYYSDWSGAAPRLVLDQDLINLSVVAWLDPTHVLIHFKPEPELWPKMGRLGRLDIEHGGLTPYPLASIINPHWLPNQRSVMGIISTHETSEEWAVIRFDVERGQTTRLLTLAAKYPPSLYISPCEDRYLVGYTPSIYDDPILLLGQTNRPDHQRLEPYDAFWDWLELPPAPPWHPHWLMLAGVALLLVGWKWTSRRQA